MSYYLINVKTVKFYMITFGPSLDKGFIKGQALGKLTGWEGDFACLV